MNFAWLSSGVGRQARIQEQVLGMAMSKLLMPTCLNTRHCSYFSSFARSYFSIYRKRRANQIDLHNPRLHVGLIVTSPFSLFLWEIFLVIKTRVENNSPALWFVIDGYCTCTGTVAYIAVQYFILLYLVLSTSPVFKKLCWLAWTLSGRYFHAVPLPGFTYAQNREEQIQMQHTGTRSYNIK